MQRRMMMLVCHAADGHFADGDRKAVRRVLERSDAVVDLMGMGAERYEILCADGGRLRLSAPGLESQRSFHRMELYCDEHGWTDTMLAFVFDLMQAGRFGLMVDVEASEFIVTSPEQVHYFPWLPQPPMLIRHSRDLAYMIDRPVSN
jgi:hypothetical protein